MAKTRLKQRSADEDAPDTVQDARRRARFAMHALAALISAHMISNPSVTPEWGDQERTQLAAEAYLFADAMMRESEEW